MKKDLVNGVWYKSPSGQGAIYRYNEGRDTIGYFEGKWGTSWSCTNASKEFYELATYEDLEACGSSHRQYVKPEDMPIWITEDGVPVKVNANLAWVIRDDYKGVWGYEYMLEICLSHVSSAVISKPCLLSPEIYRVFSTQEAAEEWVAERNASEQSQNELIAQHNETEMEVKQPEFKVGQKVLVKEGNNIPKYDGKVGIVEKIDLKNTLQPNILVDYGDNRQIWVYPSKGRKFDVEVVQEAFTIADLAEGRIVVERDGSIEDLDRILKAAFPNDRESAIGQGWEHYKYFHRMDDRQWNAFEDDELEENDLPVVKVSELIGQVERSVNEQFEGASEGVNEGAKIREFESGSKRDDDSNKPLVNHLDPYLRLRFGYLLRQGANKYDKGNWKKLQPTETALESLHRHLAKFELNLQNGVEQDEDHLSACIFNLMLIMKNEEKEGISVDHFYGTLK